MTTVTEHSHLLLWLSLLVARRVLYAGREGYPLASHRKVSAMAMYRQRRWEPAITTVASQLGLVGVPLKPAAVVATCRISTRR